MLIRFTVENFLSFNQEVEFSMVAGKGTSLEHHMVKKKDRNDVNLLKTAVIYGANASGKSNLIKAMAFARKIIIHTPKAGKSIPVTPFKLSAANAALPSRFQFEFKIGEKIYTYGFEINSQLVIEEWLYETGAANREKLIFERKTNSSGDVEVEFKYLEIKDEEQRQFLRFTGKGTPVNRLFLTETHERIKDVRLFKEVFQWFDDVLTIVFPHSKAQGLELDISLNNEVARKFEQMLAFFSTGISGLSIKEIPFEEEFSSVPQEVKDKMIEDIDKSQGIIIEIKNKRYAVYREKISGEIKAVKLMTKHKIRDAEQEIFFDMHEESDGTQRLFDLIPALLNLVQNEKVFVIDEIDRSLHPNLTRIFVELFLENSQQRSQLIITTHESGLLDLSFLRKDEIWFVEKNQHGESAVYSLEEFKPRYDKEIRKGYLLGRFGAIPFIGSTEQLQWLKKTK